MNAEEFLLSKGYTAETQFTISGPGGTVALAELLEEYAEQRDNNTRASDSDNLVGPRPNDR